MNNNDIGMTDRQFKHLTRLHMFIRKLLKLIPQEQREMLEKEYDDILQSEI